MQLPLLSDCDLPTRSAAGPSRLQRGAVRGFRAAALIAAAAVIYAAAPRETARDVAQIPLAQVRRIFASAGRVGPRDLRRDAFPVFSSADKLLGYVLKTSPETDDLIGYFGPSDLLVGLDASGVVVGVRLLSSDDTPAHVAEIERTDSFWNSFPGLNSEERAPPQIDAVSGSTLTSLAMAEAVQQRLTGTHRSLRFPDPLTLDEIRGVFPAAARLRAELPRPGWTRVEDDEGKHLGFVLRTSPQSDNVIGYAGPTETMVAVSEDERTILGLRLRRSYDTAEYVDRVRAEDDYLRLPVGKTIDEWARIDFRAAGIEGVSGATQTSYAVVEGLRRRLAAEIASPPTSPSGRRWNLRDLGLAAVLAGSLVMCFTSLRGSPRWRFVWQVILIAGFGLWFGDLLSLALVVGWSRHGLPWRTAPTLIALVAVSLVIPWASRRQIYCHHLCPHGAVQEWLGRFRRLHRRLPVAVGRLLARVPYALLALGFVLAVAAVGFDLSQLEPFDAWILRRAAVASSCIAVIGLGMSVVIPQAYCRFGCPTGALLKLIRSHGSGDRFSLRDGVVAALLLAAFGFVSLRTVHREGIVPAGRPPLRMEGEAFGTTWSVKLRTPPADAAALRTALAGELERIENTLSHWRPNSETAQFNASATTLALEFSPELIRLVERAKEFTARTDGAFDITVAPLADAWGYGPSGPKQSPPDDEELNAILQRVGSDKLVVDHESNTLQKKHPQLQLDLGAVLQGYAADRLADLLNDANAGECLIDVGGELRARGAWQVAVENPADPNRPLHVFSLRDAALATSGTYRKSANGTGETRHILSPQTGRPVEAAWRLAAVVRPTAVDADGWATALLAVASEKSLKIAEENGVAALFLDADGGRRVSSVAGNVFTN